MRVKPEVDGTETALIFEAHEVKFIVTGKTTTARLPSRADGTPPCRRGHSYTLQKRVPRVEDDNGQLIKRAQVRSTAHRLLVTSVKRDTNDHWAVTFQLDNREPTIYLHRRSERGYTTRETDAMPGEPAAVASIDDVERYARETDNERRQRQKERTLNARLKRARAAGVNTEPIIDKALGELDTAA